MRSARELNARKMQPRRHRRRKSMAAILMDAHAPSCCPKLFILRALDILTRHRLCNKHNEARPGYARFPEACLHSVYGLVQLTHRTASLPWATA
jgi:hypothetical protein